MNLSIHQYRAPRSGFPQESVFARVTARVTTFSFPLFSLSDAPPGRSSGECCLAAHSRHHGKSLLKIASAGRIRDCFLRLASCIARRLASPSRFAALGFRLSFRTAPCRGAANYTDELPRRQAFSADFFANFPDRLAKDCEINRLAR